LVTPEELDAFLQEIDEAFPTLHLSRDDVSLVQRGIVPARMIGGRLELQDRSIVREHRRDGIDGAITLMGVKYTTARAAAERAVTLAMAQVGQSAPCCTADLRLPGTTPGDAGVSPIRELDADSWHHLQRLYGAHAAGVAALAASRPELAERIVPNLPVTGLQVVEAARHEMGLTLEDIVLRRTGLGSAGYPGDAAVMRVERLLREELGWTASRAADELQLLKEFYLPVRI
jgi:glycerol-3-phosphate dehydrogenase